MRNAQISRNTAETNIMAAVELDGSGLSEINTGNGFFDHMLTLFAAHGRFDLEVYCEGDVNVDFHHSAEDIGITLGKAFSEALGEKRGINRYGSLILPMDETLMLAAVDLSGRDFLGYDVSVPTEKVGYLDTEVIREFFLGFVRNCPMSLHFKMFSGDNSHHIIEAMFKAFGRAMKQACAIDPALSDEIPSTKGAL